MNATTSTETPNGGSLQPPRSEIRPHAAQTELERTLRAHLYHPIDKLARMQRLLPGHVRRKEYRQAAECQDCIREAEKEKAMWEGLLLLYELEHSPNTRGELPPPSTKKGTA